MMVIGTVCVHVGSPLPAALTVAEQPACSVVRDRDGQQLPYIYHEKEPGRRSAAKLLSK